MLHYFYQLFVAIKDSWHRLSHLKTHADILHYLLVDLGSKMVNAQLLGHYEKTFFSYIWKNGNQWTGVEIFLIVRT